MWRASRVRIVRSSAPASALAYVSLPRDTALYDHRYQIEAQRDRLLALRCRYAQGFPYSRPLPADELGAGLPRVRVA